MVAQPARAGLPRDRKALAARACRSRQEYFPYGKSSDRRDQRNRYRYVGVERDELTDLAMTGPRTYSAVVGRFLQGDPVIGGKSPFGYPSSPLRKADPTGYQEEWSEVTETHFASTLTDSEAVGLSDAQQALRIGQSATYNDDRYKVVRTGQDEWSYFAKGSTSGNVPNGSGRSLETTGNAKTVFNDVGDATFYLTLATTTDGQSLEAELIEYNSETGLFTITFADPSIGQMGVQLNEGRTGVSTVMISEGRGGVGWDAANSKPVYDIEPQSELNVNSIGPIALFPIVGGDSDYVDIKYDMLYRGKIADERGNIRYVDVGIETGILYPAAATDETVSEWPVMQPLLDAIYEVEYLADDAQRSL